jgi:hypothetical protein
MNSSVHSGSRAKKDPKSRSTDRSLSYCRRLGFRCAPLCTHRDSRRLAMICYGRPRRSPRAFVRQAVLPCPAPPEASIAGRQAGAAQIEVRPMLLRHNSNRSWILSPTIQRRRRLGECPVYYCLRRRGWEPGMTGMGHKDQFTPRRLNVSFSIAARVKLRPGELMLTPFRAPAIRPHGALASLRGRLEAAS